MANPKRRKSLSKQRMRQHANRWRPMTLSKCKECGTPKPSHVVCPSCGFYAGRKVLDIEPVGAAPAAEE
jgi:large subunit ribosomal protein L32